MSGITEGIRAEDQTIFAQVAELMKVWILVRGTNKASLRFIGKSGYSPKPVECKAKTADQGGEKAGLVVCPILDPNAFSKGTKTEKALAAWADFAGEKWSQDTPLAGLPTGFDIETAKTSYYGCVRKNGMYLHGDYDLYDVVDPEDPTGGSRVEKLISGVPVSYSANSLAAHRALNARFQKTCNANLVQHGDQLSYADHTDDLIIAFPPEGGWVYVNPFNRDNPKASIVSLYEKIFPGRGSRKEEPFLLRQVK